jgi:hypothetical protein
MAIKLRVSRPTAVKPPIPAPKALSVLERARLFVRGLAGVELSSPMGPGQQRLDVWCKENGYCWGVVSTGYTMQGKIRTQILIGTIFEGEVEDAGGVKGEGYTPLHCWDTVDMAFDQIAEHLEANCGHAAQR